MNEYLLGLSFVSILSGSGANASENLSFADETSGLSTNQQRQLVNFIESLPVTQINEIIAHLQNKVKSSVEKHNEQMHCESADFYDTLHYDLNKVANKGEKTCGSGRIDDILWSELSEAEKLEQIKKVNEEIDINDDFFMRGSGLNLLE